MNKKFAYFTILAAVGLDVIAALSFAAVEHVSVGDGFYWSVATATTVGYGDVTPHHALGKLIAVIVMLTVIPLFAATFSLFTTILTANHVSREAGHLRRRLDHIILHHPDIPDLPEEGSRPRVGAPGTGTETSAPGRPIGS
jgi:voltage-gated potassium channel